MTDLFRLTWRTFCTPKAGNSLAENEDAVAGEPDEGRFAIADGASESAFADAWARILVNTCVQTPGPWSSWLPAARELWRAEFGERELPWYAETKFEQGAYAAILTVVFRGAHWRATAVGDCCLFQVRGGRLVRAFPIRASSQFDNRPSLVGSRRRQVGEPRARRRHAEGRLHSGDILFLMTDALAQWFLKQAEAGGEPWNRLRALGVEEEFLACMQDLRDGRELRNDDVTLGLIG